ncbi:MAG: aspartate--ammonia ligase [Bacilli bacterium]|nr:aspartate--ammonia ligase [Bacilli bacterium]
MRKELNYLETTKAIDEIKSFFERQLESRLSLRKVQAPLFIQSESGLQDIYDTQQILSFTKENEKFEIIYSLNKWKRYILERYGFSLHTGLYTEMKTIRIDEDVSETCSLLIEQWDWEKVICKEDQTIEYLRNTVKSVYKSIRQTSIFIKQKYPFISVHLPKTITFVTSQELKLLYPKQTPIERESLIAKENGTVFIIGIEDKLKSSILHKFKHPDCYNWSLYGRMLFYDKIIDRTIEITSMGIGVDKKSLTYQLKQLDGLDRLSLPFYQRILKEQLPYTIGGSIDQSRILMFLLDQSHISKVQASIFFENTLESIQDTKVLK